MHITTNQPVQLVTRNPTDQSSIDSEHNLLQTKAKSHCHLLEVRLGLVLQVEEGRDELDPLRDVQHVRVPGRRERHRLRRAGVGPEVSRVAALVNLEQPGKRVCDQNTQMYTKNVTTSNTLTGVKIVLEPKLVITAKIGTAKTCYLLYLLTEYSCDCNRERSL